MTAAGHPRLLAANTEAFMMLPLTASLFLMLRRQWLWSGLLFAAAGAFRQSAAVDVLLLPLAIVYFEPRESRVRGSALFIGGLAAGLLAGRPPVPSPRSLCRSSGSATPCPRCVARR